MLQTPLAFKLSGKLAFTMIGSVLLAISFLYATRTVIILVSPAPNPVGTSSNPVEQSITKALELIKDQTSSD